MSTEQRMLLVTIGFIALVVAIGILNWLEPAWWGQPHSAICP